jgi:predicted  nucleic acid-binding Zn-ribbon protein
MPYQDPIIMTETIVNQAATISSFEGIIQETKDTISMVNNEVKKLGENVKQLETDLNNEKQRRNRNSSDISNSPPLMKS